MTTWAGFWVGFGIALGLESLGIGIHKGLKDFKKEEKNVKR